SAKRRISCHRSVSRSQGRLYNDRRACAASPQPSIGTSRWEQSILRGVQLHLDRHVLDASDKARSQALHRSRKLGIIEPVDELAKNPFQLQARQVRAQAEVLSDAECDVRIRIAPDVEFERLCEHFFIPIRRGIKQANRFARANLLP